MIGMKYLDEILVLELYNMFRDEGEKLTGFLMVNDEIIGVDMEIVEYYDLYTR